MGPTIVHHMTEERLREFTFWPLIVTSGLFIIAYSWQVIADLQGTAYVVTRAVMAGTWLFFVFDYLVRLKLARPRGAWFRRHVFDLMVVVLPALKPLRLLKALTLINAHRQTAGTALRSRLTVYGAGAVAILIWIASLAVLQSERGVRDANIETFGDAVWWAFVTTATVGYGDFYPVTLSGRIVAVLLMVGGVAVVGVVTATLASWAIERAASGHDEDEPATRQQLRDVKVQLSAIAAGLNEPAKTSLEEPEQDDD